MKQLSRILFLFPSFAGQGGIQRFNRTLVHATESPDVHVSIVSLMDDDRLLQSQSLQPGTSVWGAAGSRALFVLKAIWRLASCRWDVVFIGHVNIARLVAMVLPWTLSRKARTILVAHGIDVWGCISAGRARSIAGLWRVLAVSSYTRTSVLDQAPGLSSERCLVFPNALSESWKQRSAGGDGEQKVPDLPEKFVLSVTRLEDTERYKGIVTVIESVTNWHDNNMHYVVVGSGNDRPFLERVAQRNGVARRVIFLSGLSDEGLREIYHKACAFVLPSGKEGFGIVFLEAMYFGVPVIAARARGALDVARDMETALLVDYGDTVALAGAVNRIATDVLLRHSLVTAGKSLVTGTGEFTEHAMRLRWKQILADGIV